MHKYANLHFTSNNNKNLHILVQYLFLDTSESISLKQRRIFLMGIRQETSFFFFSQKVSNNEIIIILGCKI